SATDPPRAGAVKDVAIIQIGWGAVGRALAEQILVGNERWAGREGIRFGYRAIVTSRWIAGASGGLSPASLRAMLTNPRLPGVSSARSSPRDWVDLLGASPTLVVDVSTGDDTGAALLDAVRRGHAVVLANARPLVGDVVMFRTLTADGRTRYEATIGAG